VNAKSRPPDPLPTGADASAPATPGTEPSPSLPAIVAHSFERLNVRSRARMLGRLLASVGPLALAVVGGGAFSKYVSMARWPEIPVSFDDAAAATSAQIFDLVRYVQQSNPQLFSQLLSVLARDTTTIAALGASIAALGIRHLAQGDAAGRETRKGWSRSLPGRKRDRSA
jgi:hypothetical protein